MPFNYLRNLFAKHPKQNRFHDVEQRALALIQIHVLTNPKDALKKYPEYKNLDSKAYIAAFDAVRNDFYALLNVDGQSTIDAETPLWLNLFLGNKYAPWRDFQTLKQHFDEHPEELTGDTLTQYRRICSMGYDDNFYDACIEVLKEFNL